MPERPETFIVFDLDMDRFVSSIDTFDGDTDYTADPKHARVFRGEAWHEFWGNQIRYRIEPV